MKDIPAELDPEDIPVDTIYSRNEVSEKLHSLNISFAKNTSTAKLNKTLETTLKKIHQGTSWA